MEPVIPRPSQGIRAPHRDRRRAEYLVQSPRLPHCEPPGRRVGRSEPLRPDPSGHRELAGAETMIAASARPWPGVGEPFWWAVRALRNELWGFRFDYPLEAVPAAGPKGSLHYHVYSERLFFDVMDLDAQGIPLQRSRLFGETYNPAYVAWYGLANLERALRGEDAAGESAFRKQVEGLAV